MGEVRDRKPDGFIELGLAQGGGGAHGEELRELCPHWAEASEKMDPPCKKELGNEWTPTPGLQTRTQSGGRPDSRLVQYSPLSKSSCCTTRLHEKPTEAPVFANPKKSEGDCHFYEKG